MRLTRLAARFVGDTETVLAEASAIFDEMLPNMAYVDKPRYPLAAVLFICSVNLSLYLALKKHGVDVHAFGGAMLTGLTRAPIPVPEESDQTRQQRPAQFAIAAEASQTDAAPGEDVIEFVSGENADFEWGYNVKSCAICQAAARYDAMSLVPYFCAVDDVMSDKGNQGLRRTGSLVLDAAHFLTGAAGGTGSTVSVSLSNPANPILPGTKLGYSDEHIVGFEQQLPGNWTVSARYLDRRVKRVVEDAAVVAPESADFFGQTYFIGNVNSKLDAAINPISVKFTPVFNSAGDVTNVPAACDPHLVNADLGVCYRPNGANGQPAGDAGSDGVPDGFPDPVRKYRAVELELNKRFSSGWQLLTNWRIARLEGNFEGHFRNDNGQTDPAISSLFDFTAGEFNLLGDQFAVGPLNTDRRHITNIYGSYAFGDQGYIRRLKGLNLGAGIHMESGVPISEYLAHPVYANAGEIPVGGRGKLGRTPFFAKLDLHADYKFSLTERWRVTLIGDFFNVTNNQKLRLPDMFRESTAGQVNPDFLKPGIALTDLTRGYYLPFNMRVGLRLEF